MTAFGKTGCNTDIIKCHAFWIDCQWHLRNWLAVYLFHNKEKLKNWLRSPPKHSFQKLVEVMQWWKQLFSATLVFDFFKLLKYSCQETNILRDRALSSHHNSIISTPESELLGVIVSKLPMQNSTRGTANSAFLQNQCYFENSPRGFSCRILPRNQQKIVRSF